MSEGNSTSIGVLGLLGVMFVGLKLTGYIDWSWWLVTLPFWGGIALLLGIIILLWVMAATIAVIEMIANRR